MDSGDGSVSRWFCRNCKRPIIKTGYTACECGCKTWVDDGTNEKWLVVDIPLGSPPVTVEGENNKGPILLSDDGESKQDCEVVENIGEDGRKRRMMEPSGGDKRRKFISGACEEISDNSEEESDPDVVIVPQLVAESENHNKGRTYFLRPRSMDKSKNKNDEESDEEESDDEESDEEESDYEECKSSYKEDCDDHNKLTPPEEKEHVSVKETLPLVFRFEDEEPLPPRKEEWEIENDNLFAEMRMCMLEERISLTNSPVLQMQSEKVSDCQMGNHKLKLDEQIGHICSVCSHVILEIKYIFPDFARRPRQRHRRKYLRESPSLLDVESFRASDSSADQDSAIYEEGTVWDLVSPNVKVAMYPHQRGGFEFMWEHIAGAITLEKLREPLSKSRGGCIISHPPGTGKTRLTIVFLQSYLKMFPKSRPVIIAPSSLLLNWEAEFQKWKVDIPFYNLNSKDFSSQEEEATVRVVGCLSDAGRKNTQLIRLVKLKSWAESKSVLGISYDLLRNLTGEDGDGNAKGIREMLLKLPGLLVLEEGHTARNEHSLVWKALKKVETEKRILLSGTPFQNNIKEFYNTLSIVCPKFAADSEQKWASLSSSIDNNPRALEELRDIIAPLVHTCSEDVKKVSLPGLKSTVIHLKPTDLQKELLKRIPENPGSLSNLSSLISVHPSLVANRKEFSDLESQLSERRYRLDPDIGVKTKFVVELIKLCDGLKERVIIFSQLLGPLKLIKEQLSSLFGWTLDREILYMDGQLDVKQRQVSINSLNDPKSEVKVLLASIKACSEGISLIGASRVVLLDVLWNPSVEQQAISRAYRKGQTKFVHVYYPVTSKWEVDKIEQQTRKSYQSDVLLSRNEVKMDPSCSVSEDNILESMVKNEGLRHIFEDLSHAPSS
ncbi:hypothetical protein KY290_034581 [Solanum tuberosum]|uniref:ATP-dependent helicase n=1 Tax=Solanum tuberosum TaxID=4113 RepID=A0ABQ7U457_SOLTU|nr:hypothetical protein KY284_033663 [Solanum tuberosum]KAH0741538.1 hypothetical protein KY290_034581 [Solanum tuberosum]